MGYFSDLNLKEAEALGESGLPVPAYLVPPHTCFCGAPVWRPRGWCSAAHQQLEASIVGTVANILRDQGTVQ